MITDIPYLAISKPKHDKNPSQGVHVLIPGGSPRRQAPRLTSGGRSGCRSSEGAEYGGGQRQSAGEAAIGGAAWGFPWEIVPKMEG